MLELGSGRGGEEGEKSVGGKENLFQFSATGEAIVAYTDMDAVNRHDGPDWLSGSSPPLQLPR